MKGAASTAPLPLAADHRQIAVGFPFESPLRHCHASTTHLPSRLGTLRNGVCFAHSKSTSLGLTAGAFSCKGILELEGWPARRTRRTYYCSGMRSGPRNQKTKHYQYLIH